MKIGKEEWLNRKCPETEKLKVPNIVTSPNPNIYNNKRKCSSPRSVIFKQRITIMEILIKRWNVYIR